MTGSLQTKNGKYYAVINSKDLNGKRKQKWISTELEVKGNKKKAEKFLREQLKEFEIRENLMTTDILFSDYIKYWLDLSKIRVDPITLKGYVSIANTQVIPYFEKLQIRLIDVDRNTIQKYINTKYENGRVDGKGGLSPKTIKTHLIIIKQALKEAVLSDYILTNPSDYVTLPKLQRREPTFYTINHELFKYLKNEPIYPLIYFTVIYGLRRSEVLGLKWDSINFETNIITIKHTVVQYKEIVEKDQTKTSSSYRSYPLTDDVKTILYDLKEKEQKNREMFGKSYIDNNHIFKWDNGKPYEPNYVSQKFRKLIRRSELPYIRFHDLRHSCASVLIANDFSLKDIQEWLGHSDIQMTANVYAHLDAKRKNNIALSMSNSFEF